MKCLLCPIILAALTGLGFAEPPKPVTVTIKTKPAQMKYDLEKISAAPGAKVTITLQNDDDLPHNLVVLKPKEGGANDKGMDVAMQAWNLGEAGMKKDWIPENPRIIAHTKMVNPHESETITFTAPEEAAEYPFVCTFPGHAMVMNGTLHVSAPVPPIKNLHYRYYIAKEKETITKLPDLSTLTSVEEGQLPSGKVDGMLHFKKRKKDYAYEFEGALDCPKNGDYTFKMGSDDGSHLWIDGKEVLKIDGVHPLNIKEKKIKLTKGEHAIKLHFFQNGGEAELYLGWSGPGFNDVPLSEFEPNPDKRKSDKEQNYGMPLVVTDEARIYRNFITGSSPRGIAVGYPGGVNICYDADQMNVALVWQGAFMDAKRHWTGRGVGDQPPLGYGVAKLGQERALAVLASQTEPWVKPYKKDQPRDMDYTFRGYELDGKTRFPTFKYDYKGVTVTESFEPSGDYKKENAALKRTVKFAAKSAVPNLYFMALYGPMTEKDGVFIFDKTVKVTVSGGDLIMRNAGAVSEVVLPVILKDGSAQFTINYSWNLK